MARSAEDLHRAQALIPLAVGAAALVAPRELVRLYGIPPEEMTGIGAFGWRLFAIRNLAVAGAALSGDQRARDVTLALQLPDQLVFAHAFKTRSIPRPTAVLAMATSGTVVALGLLARRRA